MRLLFDQNLSFKLCRHLADVFPDSSQANLPGLAEAEDRELWRYALENGYTLVTQDSDFADLALALGPPPKVIWLRCGNAPTSRIESVLRRNDIITLLGYLAHTPTPAMEHWQRDRLTAETLAGLIANDTL